MWNDKDKYITQDVEERNAEVHSSMAEYVNKKRKEREQIGMQNGLESIGAGHLEAEGKNMTEKLT